MEAAFFSMTGRSEIPDTTSQVDTDSVDAKRSRFLASLRGWTLRHLLSSEKLSATKRYKKRYKRELPGRPKKRKCPWFRCLEPIPKRGQAPRDQRFGLDSSASARSQSPFWDRLLEPRAAGKSGEAGLLLVQPQPVADDQQQRRQCVQRSIDVRQDWDQIVQREASQLGCRPKPVSRSLLPGKTSRMAKALLSGSGPSTMARNVQ